MSASAHAPQVDTPGQARAMIAVTVGLVRSA